jgi:hypothetical protein
MNECAGGKSNDSKGNERQGEAVRLLRGQPRRRDGASAPLSSTSGGPALPNFGRLLVRTWMDGVLVTVNTRHAHRR